ncbi:unnamed protein product [Effrenium voratum]|uniref:Ketosynthase family 3 (KS3) domain-containing protein n=1 Tax=Effrenium voratum TaxID=2562239 RepID=A0AA36I2X6_9DINO|nr:unnamed protein product [Effrenium voratum]
MDEEENPNDGPGLIKLDMKQFGSGTMEDPLRHAVAMRTAQDQYKMQMWNSFPPLFQNTIFHGEQDLSIAALRKASLAERLARAKELKEEGNSLLKSRSSNAEKPVEESPELSQEIERVEAAIWEKERELKELRQQLASLKAQVKPKQVPQEISEDSERQALEEAVRRYEKAAGLLRYVECIRPDWKNDDGSYKGIEDEWLRVVDLKDLEEPAEAKELVSSCYLNIALASQKLEKFDDMKKACDEVLGKVNPSSAKALYRRACARMAPASAVDADRDAAIQDLVAAAKLAPQDKEVRSLLNRLRDEKKKQELEKRSTFGGLFQRGEVVKEVKETNPKAEPSNWDLNDPKVQEFLDIRPGSHVSKTRPKTGRCTKTRSDRKTMVATWKEATHTGKLYLKYKDFDPLEGSICCGTQLAYSPYGFVGCCGGGMLSFLGRCFTYDKTADGYLRGEGVAGIFLELQEYSKEAFAAMPASQANQDGKSASITAPNGPSQEKCIKACFREAKYLPSEVDCFETHGTGTALGDPIEVGAFRRIYVQSPRVQPLLVTSSKTNLGHLEGCAGMAGFIKCALQVMRCECSPNIHLRERNPHLETEGFPAQFVSEGMVTQYNSCVSGVSSFGFGGTNAHAMAFGQNICTSRDVTRKDFRRGWADHLAK